MDIKKNSPNSTGLDVESIRRDFPTLHQEINGKPLVYFDHAATSQKPSAVIQAVENYYRTINANIHRGVHHLSQAATDAFEASREKVRHFINADSTKEIVFCSGTTGAINLVAASFGQKYIREGDEILISHLEHHSNIVPWQLLCDRIGARLRVIPVNDNGELMLEEYEKLLNHRTKLVSVIHISNSLGTINPIKQMVEAAHRHGARVLVDGAQATSHTAIDVLDLDCDFYAFSGHKMCAPTGVGVLYGKQELLSTLPPYQGGGDMILSVSFEKTIYNELPHRFEAGTPNISGVIGLGAAIDYLDSLGFENIEPYEQGLLRYATDAMSTIKSVKIIGKAARKSSTISFISDKAHPHDIGTILDHEGIAIRTGHHCTQPLMSRFGIPGTSRISLSFYNTTEDIDRFMIGIDKVFKMFF
ncbi:MAG: cysteine sulfinate desulfinase [Candidatus Cloacimonetes bacterium 4572_55]|nr:MAG: cysteine sulfinate desulfinase [Candidatus Cloacimonetes bacterium 4572_55]